MPRFRVRREGSVAYYGDMMHLRSERLHGYALRISGVACDEHEDEPRVNEANLSLQVRSEATIITVVMSLHH